MQLVNDAPVPNPESVSIAALQFLQIVVRSVRVCRNLFDLRHDSSLPIHRQLGKGLVERLRHDDAVHGLIVTHGNNYTPAAAGRAKGSVVLGLAIKPVPRSPQVRRGRVWASPPLL